MLIETLKNVPCGCQQQKVCLHALTTEARRDAVIADGVSSALFMIFTGVPEDSAEGACFLGGEC